MVSFSLDLVSLLMESCDYQILQIGEPYEKLNRTFIVATLKPNAKDTVIVVDAFGIE